MNSTPILRLALLLSLTACGVDSQQTSSQDARTTDSSAGDATAKKKVPKAKPTTETQSAAGDLDCSGIVLHEGHERCDADDVTAIDGETPSNSGAAGDNTAAKPGPVTPVPTPTPTAPTTPTDDPNIVIFRVQAGTGTAPWNVAAQTVQVKVGQTLRLINDDSIIHRLHTNGAPCPHGSNFAPGTSYDCKITKAFDSAKTPAGMYDHIAGMTATFNVKVSP